MKSSAGILLVGLLGAEWCMAQVGEAERRQAEAQREVREAQRQVEAARRRAEEAKRQQGGLQHPIFKYPDPNESRAALAEDFYVLGLFFERQGKGLQAVESYALAAREDYGRAARRLARIYEAGIPGVAADAELARKWGAVARRLGAAPPKALKP